MGKKQSDLLAICKKIRTGVSAISSAIINTYLS